MTGASLKTIFLAILLSSSPQGGASPIIVAHRGASAYLPEHTLPAVALAHGMGADFIEQDVVLTKDDVPVVLHDTHLETVTDVAAVFPDRSREDGRYYAIDFTLEEIKRLRVNERMDLKTGKPVYERRFPLRKSVFRVPTLAEEIELIQGLNSSTGRSVGIYVEIKAPAWHRNEGKDVSRRVLEVIQQYGYKNPSANAYVQCFDSAELKRVRKDMKCKLRLVQLIGENTWHEASTDFEHLRTPEGIRQTAEYADGIGPWLPHVVSGRDDRGQLVITPLVAEAHKHGLQVFPYTFRADELPEYVETFEELLDVFVKTAKVDGLFTDFPDLAVRYRRRQSRRVGTAPLFIYAPVGRMFLLDGGFH